MDWSEIIFWIAEFAILFLMIFSLVKIIRSSKKSNKRNTLVEEKAQPESYEKKIESVSYEGSDGRGAISLDESNARKITAEYIVDYEKEIGLVKFEMVHSRFFAVTMARILIEMGFFVDEFYLSGFSEWDTGHADYTARYCSIDEFKEKSILDYINDDTKGVCLEWTSTSVKLHNEEKIKAYFKCDEFWHDKFLEISYQDDAKKQVMKRL